MKKIFNIQNTFLALTLLVAFAACKRDKQDVVLQPRNERDIVEVMQRETKGDFTMFLEALKVTGLDQLLSVEPNKEPTKRYVVFAPTNKAFGALLLQFGVNTVNQLDLTILTETIKAHIYEIPGDAKKNFKLKDMGEGTYPSLQQSRDIVVSISCDEVPYINGKTVVAFERAAKNGHVVAVEDILFTPASTLAQVLRNDPELSILNQLIGKAGLTGVFEDLSKQYTIIAPSNQGFIDYNMLPQNFNTPAELALLDSVLRYHVIAGRYYSLSMCDQKPYVTLLGQDIQTDARGTWGGRYNDWVDYLERNANFARNGVVHKVDYPMIPAFINIRQRIAQLPETPSNPNDSYAIAKQALALTGLDVELERVDRVTVLLPNDAAFNAFLALNNINSIYDIPVATLTELMKFHVLTRRMFFLDLSPASGPLVSVKTLQGENMNTPRRTGTTATSVAGATEYVGIPSLFNNNPAGRIDMKLSNGNIHCIRKVQVPKAVKLKQVP
jgi:uncharacterized surface protein with fasciclin (FAS1) repeats